MLRNTKTESAVGLRCVKDNHPTNAAPGKEASEAPGMHYPDFIKKIYLNITGKAVFYITYWQ